MKYLLLSSCGLELFLVPRLCAVKEVEKVYFWHMDSHYKSAGKDMENCPGWEKFQLIADWLQALRESNKEELVIVIGDVGLGETGDYLRKMGYKVIGGSRFGDRAEDDRTYATSLMSKIMKVPESTDFSSFQEGIGFLKAKDKSEEYVFKPNSADVPKEYTFKGKDIPTLIAAMKEFKTEWKWKESFQIQKVVKGVECDFNCYFNGEQFIENSFIVYFEEKGMMDGNSGPATGGSVAVEFVRPAKGELWETLIKLTPYLKKVGYKGQLAINSIVSEEDHHPYFLEFCVREGFPSFPLEITLLEDNGKSVHDLFMAMINNENPKNLFPTDKIAVTVSVFVPPAPTAESYMMEGTKGQIISWDKKWDSYFFPYYVQWNESKGMVLAGVSSWVLQTTCVDSTLDGASQMLYDTYMKTLQLKNAMFRSDLKVDAKKRISKLKEWGLI